MDIPSISDTDVAVVHSKSQNHSVGTKIALVMDILALVAGCCWFCENR